jgi:hypothetical protein
MIREYRHDVHAEATAMAESERAARLHRIRARWDLAQIAAEVRGHLTSS